MTHKIQWEDHMTTAEYEALPLGTTIHTLGNGSYQKVGGWGRYDETLLLDVQTYELKSPGSVITFKEMTYCKGGIPLRDHYEDVLDMVTYRDSIIEECADVAESFVHAIDYDNRNPNDVASDIYDEIRALKGKEKERAREIEKRLAGKES